MKVMVFGQLTEVTGSDEIKLAASSNTSQLREDVLHQFPLLNEKKFVIAVLLRS